MQFQRQFLRHRKLHTKAFAHVSNDKTHDSHAAQTFINKTISYLEERYVRTGKESWFACHMHSDNAPSHFKSSKTMHYVTTLLARFKGWWADQGQTRTSFRVFCPARRKSNSCLSLSSCPLLSARVQLA